MAALGPLHRALMHGIVLGIFAGAASSSAAPVDPASARAIAVRPAFTEYGRGGFEALLQILHRDLFCRWYRQHRLCVRLIASPAVCARFPDHHLCAKADDGGVCGRLPDHPLCRDRADNRFCEKGRDHPLCDDDDRFCNKRRDHPLCNDDPPPSPS